MPDGSPRLPSNARLRPSNRTLAWEITAFKSFLTWAKKNSLYKGDANLFVFKGGISARRSAFTYPEWARITGAMRRKEWLSVGKHQNDPRLARYRKMLRAYVFFLAHTGLRIGEARNLQWQDITFAKNKDGDEICIVVVSQSYSKVGKRRKVPGNAKAAEVIKELLAARTSNNDFCKPSDFVWCNETGRVIKDFREGFNKLLELPNAELDSDNKKHVLYCLRHYYITEKLKDSVSIYEIAANCGTSVAMIEKYYSDALPSDFVIPSRKAAIPQLSRKKTMVAAKPISTRKTLKGYRC